MQQVWTRKSAKSTGLLSSRPEAPFTVQKGFIQPNHVLSRECEVDMWIPDKLYEFLPVLYGIAGLVTFYKFDTAIGYASGILLILTAGLVWMMRRDYRQVNIKKRKLKH
jgi:hypothetical protein